MPPRPRVSSHSYRGVSPKKWSLKVSRFISGRRGGCRADRRAPTPDYRPLAPGPAGGRSRPCRPAGSGDRIRGSRQTKRGDLHMSTFDTITGALGDEAKSLLEHACTGIPKESLHLPGPDVVDRIWAASDRPIPVLRSLQQLVDHGRLAGTGYLSILPVDQGIEHSAGASFAKNPTCFDPEGIVKTAVEGGCNAVASTLGVLGAVARRYAHKIPFLLKINHNEFLTYPNKFDQIMFAHVKQARDMGCVAVGATIYFGSDQSGRQIVEVSQVFHAAYELGMATVLWCYLRNPAFKMDKDYYVSADLTGQANHLGVTIEADIIKQKLPE